MSLPERELKRLNEVVRENEALVMVNDAKPHSPRAAGPRAERSTAFQAQRTIGATDLSAAVGASVVLVREPALDADFAR